MTEAPDGCVTPLPKGLLIIINMKIILHAVAVTVTIRYDASCFMSAKYDGGQLHVI